MNRITSEARVSLGIYYPRFHEDVSFQPRARLVELHIAAASASITRIDRCRDIALFPRFGMNRTMSRAVLSHTLACSRPSFLPSFLPSELPKHMRTVDLAISLWMSIVGRRTVYLEASHEFSKLSVLATGMRAPRHTGRINAGVPRARVSRF